MNIFLNLINYNIMLHFRKVKTKENNNAPISLYEIQQLALLLEKEGYTDKLVSIERTNIVEEFFNSHDSSFLYWDKEKKTVTPTLVKLANVRVDYRNSIY